MQTTDILEGKPCCDDVLSKNALIPEEVLDELDVRGVPIELIQFWSEQETKVLSRAKPDKIVEFLPASVREVALHFLADLMGLQQSGVLDAARLLDLYCFLKDASIEMLPATCVAVVTLLIKSSNSQCQVFPSELAKNSLWFVQWLNSAGYTSCAEVSSSKIIKQEEAVLRVLGWHINAPSVNKWMMVLCDRFDIISRHKYTSSLEWVFQRGVTAAGVLVTQVTASSIPAQTLANGLFSLYLITGRMLSLDALRPPKVSASTWEELYIEGQCQGTLPSCALAMQVQAFLFQTLQLATGCEICTLQANLHETLTIMKHVFMIARARIGPHTPSVQQSVI